MNKIVSSEEMIKLADSIFHNNLLEFDINYLDKLDPDEKRRISNQYSIFYAQICEYYLKALLLPNLSAPGIPVYSDAEMKFLATSSSGLKQYNHIFKKIIFDSKFDDDIRDAIINYLANHCSFFADLHQKTTNEVIREQHKDMVDADKLDEIGLREGKVIMSLSSKIAESDLLAKLFDDVINSDMGIIKNSDAYPRARYAMIDPENYEAKIEFLMAFTFALRSVLRRKFVNCISLTGCARHIFPDLNSKISVTYETGNSVEYFLDDQGVLWLSNDAWQGSEQFGYIWDYDLKANAQSVITDVSYVEHGLPRLLKLDKLSGHYLFMKSDLNRNNTINEEGKSL